MIPWSLAQLAQFISASEAGSFSAAARALGRSQSVISTNIALLEADLGLTLFDRQGRAPTLTPEGEIILAEAKELLRQANTLQQRALSLHAAGASQFSLGFDVAIPFSVIVDALRDFAQVYPALELTIHQGSADKIRQWMDEGRLNLGFLLSHISNAQQTEQGLMGYLPQTVVVGKDHPLATQNQHGLADLVKHRQLLLHQGDDVQAPAYSPQVWHCDNFYMIAALAALNVGWAILPINIARYWAFEHQLVELSVPRLALSALPIKMLWQSGSPLNAPAQWFEARFMSMAEHSFQMM